MNKSELIDTLSKKEGLTEKQAADVVNLIFKGFGEQLKRGGRIEIRGFGSFCCKELRSVHGKKSQRRERLYRWLPKSFHFSRSVKSLRKELIPGNKQDDIFIFY